MMIMTGKMVMIMIMIIIDIMFMMVIIVSIAYKIYQAMIMNIDHAGHVSIAYKIYDDADQEMIVTNMIMMVINIDHAGHVQSQLGAVSFSVEGTLTLAVKVKTQCFR